MLYIILTILLGSVYKMITCDSPTSSFVPIFLLMHSVGTSIHSVGLSTYTSDFGLLVEADSGFRIAADLNSVNLNVTTKIIESGA